MELDFMQEVIHNKYFHILLAVIVLDILAGTIRAILQKRLNSSIGTVGLLKHMLIIVTLSVIVLFAPAFDLKVVANTIIGFYTFQYALSIVENWEAIGLPVPKWVKSHIKNKKKQLDGEDPLLKKGMI